jgi:hypothetical protein
MEERVGATNLRYKGRLVIGPQMHAWVMVMERLAVLLNRLYVISAITVQQRHVAGKM